MWTVIEDWADVLRAGGAPDSTVSLRRHQLRRLAADFPRGPAAVTGDALVEWVAGRGWARETLRSHRAAFRRFFGWAVRTGLLEDDPSEALPAVPPTRPSPRPAPEWVVELTHRVTDERVRLMCCLAAHAGLRRGEIARAHSSWLVEDAGGWSLRVLGKGGRVRVVPLPGWLATMVRSRGDGWLFPGASQGHVSPGWVGKLVTRELPDAWTTHTLRHRFATRVYAGSRDLLATQELLGHSKPETTRAYVAVDASWLRDAARHAA